jgi:hypothetical protein
VTRRPSLLRDEIIEVAPGRNALDGVLPTVCRLRLYQARGAPPTAMVTELPGNPGPSITNAAEHIWKALAAALSTPSFVMVEHYARETYPGPAREGLPTFDVVTVVDGLPHWRRLTEAERRTLIGQVTPLAPRPPTPARSLG